MYRSAVCEKKSERASELLLAIRNHVPQRLIDDESYDNLIKTASSVPINFALSPFLLECSLDDSSRTADLSFGLPVSDYCHAFQAFGLDKGHSILPESISSMIGQVGTLLKNQLCMIWLEYDVGKKPSSFPSLFLTPKTGSPSQAMQIVKDIRQELGELYIDAQYSQKAGEVFQRLPDKSSVRQIGIMASRSATPLRLCLAGLDRSGWQKIANFLDKVEYGSCCRELSILYEELEPFVDICDLSLDLTERIEPRIGLELMIRQRNPQREQAWNQVLNKLEREGLCSQDKMDEVLNFYGFDSIIGNQVPWPRSLTDYWKEHKEHCCSFFIWCINHLKICFDPAVGTSAKVYLKIIHHWKDL